MSEDTIVDRFIKVSWLINVQKVNGSVFPTSYNSISIKWRVPLMNCCLYIVLHVTLLLTKIKKSEHWHDISISVKIVYLCIVLKIPLRKKKCNEQNNPSWKTQCCCSIAVRILQYIDVIWGCFHCNASLRRTVAPLAFNWNGSRIDLSLVTYIKVVFFDGCIKNNELVHVYLNLLYQYKEYASFS